MTGFLASKINSVRFIQYCVGTGSYFYNINIYCLIDYCMENPKHSVYTQKLYNYTPLYKGSKHVTFYKI